MARKRGATEMLLEAVLYTARRDGRRDDVELFDRHHEVQGQAQEDEAERANQRLRYNAGLLDDEAGRLMEKDRELKRRDRELQERETRVKQQERQLLQHQQPAQQQQQLPQQHATNQAGERGGDVNGDGRKRQRGR